MVPRAVRPRIKHEKPMRKVIVGAMVSMDGVMQAPGGPLTVPVVLGGGKKLFADGSAPHSFKLTSSRVSSTGVLIGHYERDGEIKIGGTALDSPSEREIARQERMKREG
jgi:hypothetical protein